MDDPRTFHVMADSDGFYIEDDYGDEVGKEHTRYPSRRAAELAILDMIDNWEPPELGDAWTGGFAENH